MCIKERLEANELERVEVKYRNHPLMCTCQSAFRSYYASMNTLMFSPVEVFIESVEVIDDLLDDNTDRIVYIKSLWEELTIRYKLWLKGKMAEREVEMAVCSVFYMVAVVISRHPFPYFCATVREALLNEIDKHQSIIKEDEDEVIVSLVHYADELENWVMKYAYSDDYLSDEIDDVAHGRMTKAEIAAFPQTGEKDKDGIRDKKKKDYTMYSFNYNPKGFNRQMIANRLAAALVDLKQWNFVDSNTTEDSFSNVFTGVDTKEKICWKGARNELWYFISTLHNTKVDKCCVLDWKHPGPGTLQIISYRFLLWDKVFKPDENGVKHATYEYRELTANELVKDSKPKDQNRLQKLNTIINGLIPPTHDEEIVNDIEEEMSRLGRHQQDEESDGGKILYDESGFNSVNH